MFNNIVIHVRPYICLFNYQYTVNQETVNEREDREIIKFKKLVPKLINTAFSLENRLLQYFNIKLSDMNNMAICEKCSDIKGG